MSNENVIPFPVVIDPMRFMQMPKVTTELLSKGLIDLDSYKQIAAAMAADVKFIYSVANDFFTEQFDANDMSWIAGLLKYMAEMMEGKCKDPESGNATDLEIDLRRAQFKLERLDGRLAAMKQEEDEEETAQAGNR